MSVLIKGIDIPEDCPMCPLAHWTVSDTFAGCEITKKYFEREELETNYRPEFCPLVKIPEQHGNLIDVDAYINEIEFKVKIAKQIARYDTERAKDMKDAIVAYTQIISELENREVIIKREE